MESTRLELAKIYKRLAYKVQENARLIEADEGAAPGRQDAGLGVSRQDLEDLWAVGAVLAGIREGRL